MDFNKLDEKHFAVLRGVEELKNSKEIARDLNISPHTVDQRLKRVQSILNVSSRFEAARIYREHREASGESENYQSLVYQSPALSAAAEPPKSATSDGEWNPLDDDEKFAAHEAQAPYFANAGPADNSSFQSVLLKNEGQNTLSFWKRTVAIAGIMVASIIIFIGLLNAAEILSGFY